MTKLNLTLITLLFTISISIAQNRFGVHVGVNHSSLSKGVFETVNLSFSDDLARTRQSFHIAGLYEMELTNKIKFRPELMLSIQGRNPKEENDGSPVPINYGLTYINTPLNFKFFSKPYIIAGPQLGVLIATNVGDGDIGPAKTFDFGFGVGFGYDFSDFYIQTRFYQGIQTVIEEPNLSIPPRDDKKLTNTVIQLSFGYYFDI